MNAAAEKAAAGFVAAGFPKMPARALMALVSSEDGSLTAAGLADRLGVSAAAVSGAVRYLQTVGFVHRVSQPGSRRDLYALYDDEWYIASMRKSPIYQSLAALTDSTAEALPEGSAARSRVAEMGRFYRFLAARMPALLDDWERQRAGDSRKALSGDVRAGDSRSGEVLSRDALSRDALSKGGRP
ncbi:MAG TPA: MarR family transcriptional regulator [Arthrobacter sp.]|nr:MarR family transcriptional regulator [Arthrobacter sp.]